MNEEEFYQWLGGYIKSLRRVNGKTQMEVCKTFRLSRPTLSNIESGRHRISTYDLYQLLGVLDEPAEHVIDSFLTLHRQSKF